MGSIDAGHGRGLRAAVTLALPLLMAAALGSCRGPQEAADVIDLDRDLDFAMRSARAGLWSEALYRWERAADLRPEDARLFNNLGVAYEHEGRYDDAEKAYAKAAALDPADTHIQKNVEAFQSFRSSSQKEGDAADGASPEGEGGSPLGS